MTVKSRILLLDAYDSFTYNLANIVEEATSATIHVAHIDSLTISELIPFLSCFDAIVVGPGPGSPENDSDVGIVKHLWNLADEHLLPVFGVCLGLQSLCIHFGGVLKRLSVVKHGLISNVDHCNKDLFAGVGTVDAVRYHSLHVDLHDPRCAKATLDELEELAVAHDGPEENGDVLMAVKHRSKPFWAVQYHPESVCTSGGGAVVQNFWKLAKAWSRERQRHTTPLPPSWTIPPRCKSLVRQQQLLPQKGLANGKDQIPRRPSLEVSCSTLMAPYLSTVRICELLKQKFSDEVVLLESLAAPGRMSVIGILVPHQTETIAYIAGDSHVSLSKFGGNKSSAANKEEQVDLDLEAGGNIWTFLAEYMDSRKASKGMPDSIFWGGLVGYFGYEIGVHALGVPLRHRSDGKPAKRPDVNLAYVERSIVHDTLTGKIFIQSVLPSDGDWIGKVKQALQLESDLSVTPSPTPPPLSIKKKRNEPLDVKVESAMRGQGHVTNKPPEDEYKGNISRCQEYLFSGESYELCLTAPTTIELSRVSLTAWEFYKHLRTKNPAPYAAFFSLQGTTVVGSSPERFLSWTRDGKCQLRPIKGTVKKLRADGSIVTREEATAVLSSPKERAENLMIVDLIRHDLHQVAAQGTVRVSKLMAVEEYETVFQLVSVIEGDLDENMREDEGFTGFDVLARSLPPGSMTGAPKKRSVEILQELEPSERGVYSGVLGYWSVCGAGDWSVVIRTAIRYNDEQEQPSAPQVENEKSEVWRLGAGGAITALSSVEDEWEEMITKLESTHRAFTGKECGI